MNMNLFGWFLVFFLVLPGTCFIAAISVEALKEAYRKYAKGWRYYIYDEIFFGISGLVIVICSWIYLAIFLL